MIGLAVWACGGGSSGAQAESPERGRQVVHVEPPPTETEPDDTPPPESARVVVDPDGGMAGIGAVVFLEDGALVVRRVLEDGGAAEAGLVRGDLIVRIDGVSVAQLGLQKAVAKIRGAPGSTLVFAVMRHDSSAPRDVVVVRRLVEVQD